MGPNTDFTSPTRHQLMLLQRLLAVLIIAGSRTVCATAAHSRDTLRPKIVGNAALALQGGGFRAFSSNTGLITGLLAAHAGTKPNIIRRKPTLVQTGLLKRFETISSGSGSSWFSAALIYSDHFRELVENMATVPGLAKLQFSQHFTVPWMRAAQLDNWKFSYLVALSRLVLGNAVTDYFQEMFYFLVTGFTWNNYVDVFLNSTANIGNQAGLGSPVGEWASGKVWLVCHTVVLPRTHHAHLIEGDDPIQATYNFAYKAVGSDPSHVPHPFLPAKFSVRLGAGINSSAPLPYVPSSVVSHLKPFEYTGEAFDQRHVATSPPLDGFGLSVSQQAGALPIARAVAASSAVWGAACMSTYFRFERLGMALISGDVTPWIAISENDAFAEADRLMNNLKEAEADDMKDALDAVAKSSVHGVIDSGFTDGTGIAHAVATGAREVVVVLNSDKTNDPTFFQKLFPGGDQPIPQSAALFPVFSKPSAVEVKGNFSEFQYLEVSPESMYLRVLAVGTITASTTNSSFFGIEGGHDVKIHIINIASDLNIGLLADFHNYDDLVQDIISTLTSEANFKLVHEVVLPLFLGELVPDQKDGGELESVGLSDENGVDKYSESYRGKSNAVRHEHSQAWFTENSILL